MNYALNKLDFRIAIAVQFQIEVGFAVFSGEDAAASSQIAVGQRDRLAFRRSGAGRDRIRVGNQFQLAADDHRLHDAVLHRDMVHFIAVHLVAGRAEAWMAAAIPTSINIARRLDDRFGLQSILVWRDQREVALDAMRLQDALDDLLRPRIGVNRAPKKRMPLLKYHIVKFLSKFSDHFLTMNGHE